MKLGLGVIPKKIRLDRLENPSRNAVCAKLFRTGFFRLGIGRSSGLYDWVLGVERTRRED